MAIDEIQMIAQARADMIMRGVDALRILIGPATLNRIRNHRPEHLDPEGRKLPARSGVILNIPFQVHDDIEGFAVVADFPE